MISEEKQHLGECCPEEHERSIHYFYLQNQTNSTKDSGCLDYIIYLQEHTLMRNLAAFWHVSKGILS